MFLREQPLGRFGTPAFFPEPIPNSMQQQEWLVVSTLICGEVDDKSCLEGRACTGFAPKRLGRGGGVGKASASVGDDLKQLQGGPVV